MKLGAVVPCTSSKSGPAVHAAARNIDHDRPITEAADRWRSRLEAAPQGHIARGLYNGPGWVASLRMVDALQSTGAEVSWRIISAGYGLLHPDEEVTTYSATFLAGHADSVPGAASGANASLTWWAEVNRLRGQAQPLVRLASEVNGLVVAASTPYIDAIAEELTAVAQQVPTVVFCAGRPQDRTVARLAPRFDRRLREGAEPFVRGGDVGFNQRVAAKVVRLLGSSVIDRARVDEVLAAAMDRERPLRHGRQVASDATVMAFIDAALTSDPSASRTALLRRWRDRGRACEQGRFRVLYEQVVAERRGQPALGEAACG
jgi:hypothetical protein